MQLHITHAKSAGRFQHFLLRFMDSNKLEALTTADTIALQGSRLGPRREGVAKRQFWYGCAVQYFETYPNHIPDP